MTITWEGSPRKALYPSEIRLQALQLAIKVVELRNSTHDTTTIIMMAKRFEQYLTEG